METFLNIAGLFFMLSGMAAWFFAFSIYVFYLACLRPPEEE
jgi:hypothetical protein